LSCLGVQVVFDYKICLLWTIDFWGVFLASSDFLVIQIVAYKARTWTEYPYNSILYNLFVCLRGKGRIKPKIQILIIFCVIKSYQHGPYFDWFTVVN